MDCPRSLAILILMWADCQGAPKQSAWREGKLFLVLRTRVAAPATLWVSDLADNAELAAGGVANPTADTVNQNCIME